MRSLLILLCMATLAACSTPGGEGTCTGKCDDVTADAGESGDDGGTAALCDGAAVFPDHWISGGPDCGSEPEIQVHQLNADTVVLRQSLCTSFEAPFLYLLFGDDRVLLEDTGAGGVPVDDVVDELIAEREAATGRDLELVVMNSHAHLDHVQGNELFAGRADTTVVGFTAADVVEFTGMAAWPGRAELDLGGRVIDVLGIPGHEASHIALYDRQYGLLLTGDTLYPGRLFIDNFADYVASIESLVEFTAESETCFVLGTHIELSSTPGDDYEFGATHHPDERELQLGREHLVELLAALEAMGGVPTEETHDDFIIVPL